MRFMIIRKADADTEAGAPPSQQLLTAMGDYMESLSKAGVLLGGEGLAASDRGFRVTFEGGRPTVTDGPFAETKELIAGYTLIEVRSREEAMEWVRRWPAIDGNGAAVLEVRQVLEADDFGDQFTPEDREREARLRAEAARRV